MSSPAPLSRLSDDEMSCSSPLSSDLDSDQFSPNTRQKCKLPSPSPNTPPEKTSTAPTGLGTVSLSSPKSLIESFDWTENMIGDLVQTMEETFPWEEFAVQHGISADLLRQAVRELVVTPLCFRSEGRLQEFFNRVLEYYLARQEYYKYVSKEERQKARQEARQKAQKMRQNEKLISKEMWKEKKAQLKKELEVLEAAGENDERAQAAIDGQKAVIQEAKRQRKAQKAAEKDFWETRLSQMPDIHSDESAEDET
ncbi:MAG: hypothetical protein Q9225_007612 [Loekoesia sp. 1 TL-2023]